MHTRVYPYSITIKVQNTDELVSKWTELGRSERDNADWIDLDRGHAYRFRGPWLNTDWGWEPSTSIMIRIAEAHERNRP